jgi:hypothetical protein
MRGPDAVLLNHQDREPKECALDRPYRALLVRRRNPSRGREHDETKSGAAPSAGSNLNDLGPDGEIGPIILRSRGRMWCTLGAL